MSQSDDGRYRLFFALWPEPGLRERIEQRTRAATRDGGGRTVPARNFHITLLFIGDVSRPQLELASSAAAAIANPAFELSLDRIQTPPRARVTWLSASKHPAALESLVQELRLRCSAAMPEPLGHARFVAHVTLLRDPTRRTPLLAMEPLLWPAREFALMQSQTHSAGSEYSVLARWPLV